MRTVEIADVTALLSRFTQAKPRKDTVLVTRQGKPVAALVPVAGDDWEDFVVSNDPGFAAVMKRSEERYKAEGGTSLEDVRAKYGLPPTPAPKRRRSRKTSAAR